MKNLSIIQLPIPSKHRLNMAARSIVYISLMYGR